jgi:hypothetical protein
MREGVGKNDGSAAPATTVLSACEHVSAKDPAHTLDQRVLVRGPEHQSKVDPAAGVVLGKAWLDDHDGIQQGRRRLASRTANWRRRVGAVIETVIVNGHHWQDGEH